MVSHQLRRDLADIEMDIDSYVSKGTDIPDEMKERHESLKLELNNIIYPVLTLPTEITVEIFEKLLTKHTNPRSLSPTEAPLLLLHICRAWRAIALSTPSLWTTLAISFKGFKRQITSDPLPRTFGQWPTCACATPKTLSLYGDATGKDGEHMSAVLHRHAPQLVSLRLSLYPLDLHRLLEPIQFPALEAVVLDQAISRTCPAWRIFESTPQLRDVTLLFEIRPHHLILPWSQLTTFSGDRFTALECYRVLSDSPALQKCEFQ
ncbi:hypothetical protein GGX14DRAFT_578973 [Mycena pura]|uniref:F-box domain-containing protein n=1 Tax=Mycena pura TaxID=153505 RepID=A0AAD6UNI7_9AGAR|nr:hypothetical protein GGX14DRAFT_578973 [Mycena pura]